MNLLQSFVGREDTDRGRVGLMNLLHSFVGREDTDRGEGGADELGTEFCRKRRFMTSCSATDGNRSSLPWAPV